MNIKEAENKTFEAYVKAIEISIMIRCREYSIAKYLRQ